MRKHSPEARRTRLSRRCAAGVTIVAIAALVAPAAFGAAGPARGHQAAGGAPITPPNDRERPDRLTLELSPRRDATAPYTTRASGRLVATAVSAQEGCRGVVALAGFAGGRTVLSVVAPLELVAGRCRYAASIRIDAQEIAGARVVRLKATFTGNDALRGASSWARYLRVG